jgi:TolB-like protein/DNA-binding winged helix-turn-helix (wHTH) protein
LSRSLTVSPIALTIVELLSQGQGTHLGLFAMKTTTRRTALFGPHTLDLRSGELRKFGTRVKMGEQTFQILRALLETPGELVTREELRAKIWAGDTFVDFDHGLNSAVQRLRDCLSDSAEKPRWVETVPRRGYRFVGQVEWSDDAPPSEMLVEPGNGNHVGTSGSDVPASRSLDAPEIPRSTGVGQIAPRTLTKRTKVWIFALVIVLVLAVITLLSLGKMRGRLVERGTPPSIQSIAVLPLANLSSDASQDFLADGMTEELITDLGKIAALRVISRTSVMRYKGTTKPLSEIAHELNVDAIVEGTVAKSNTRLRITANLVQASPEKHLWAESYEREIGDALTVQGEIARAVAQQIQVKLTQREQNLLAVARPFNPEAQDLYLRGMYVFRAGTAESYKKAIDYFQQAIQKDPNYAAAYAGLADVYGNWVPGMNRPRDRMPKAKEFALKALQLDNTMADPHSVLGYVELFYDWDWSAAEEQYRLTMALSPNNAWAHEWHARGLAVQGRTEEAIREANQVIALSPSPLTWDYPIWVYFLARRNDLALARARELLEVAPDFVWGHFEMAQIYEQQGLLKEGAQESLKADELFGTDPHKVAQLKKALAKSGAQGYWKQTLENYRESAKSDYVPSVMVAEACVRVGDKNSAFEWLERGFEERDDLMINLQAEPAFESLRSDPRFQNLVRRVGIPQ